MATRVFAVDVETHPIRPGNITPRLVCVSWAERGSDGRINSGIFDRKDGIAFYRLLLELAVKREAIIVGQNFVYDNGVFCNEDDGLLELVFEAYAVGAFRDTKERQKLIDLADGEMKFARNHDGEFIKQVYTLEALARRHLAEPMEKGAGCKNIGTRGKAYYTFTECGCGAWRLHYKDLDGVPLADWPLEAKRYPILDAEIDLRVYEHQQATQSPVVELDPDGIVRVRNEVDQLRAHWALQLQSIWGIRTNPDSVAALRAAVEREQDFAFRAITRYERMKQLPVEERVYKIHQFKRGPRAGAIEVSRNQAAIQKRVFEGFQKQGLKPPLTEGGENHEVEGGDVVQTLRSIADRLSRLDERLEAQKPFLKFIAISAEAMKDSKDPVLKRLAKVQYGTKLLSTYIPALETGSTAAINVSYNLLLESGRTSVYGDFNPQVLPRKDGVRECIEPRPGYWLCSNDYDQVELCTLGQAQYDLLGSSTIGDAINAGRDLHVQFAAYWLGIPYDEAISRYKRAKKGDIHDPEILDRRQIAKVPDFGKPGGMGDLSLIDFAKATYGIILTPESAAELSRVYFEAHPDMRDYFKYISTALGPMHEGPVEQLRSGRIRGGCTFCQACNTYFQGLAADGAKLALWRVARECYEGGMHVLMEPRDDRVCLPYHVGYVPPKQLTKDHGAIEFAPGQWRSPLFGTRPIAFVHDEILAEVPQVIAHEAAFRLSAVMNAAMQEYVPKVKISSTPALMTKWCKGADTKFDDNKRLIPWQPKKAA